MIRINQRDEIKFEALWELITNQRHGSGIVACSSRTEGPRDIALKIKREIYIATAQYEQEVFDGDKPADSATMPTMSTPRRNSRNSLTLKKEALSLETASDSSIPAVSLSPTLSPSAMLTDIIEDSSTSA